MRKLEKLITNIIFYVMPIFLIGFLILFFFSQIKLGELSSNFAQLAISLLMFLLIIKPLALVSKKYFTVSFWKITDFFKYLITGRTQKPILIYIKELLLNIIYGLSLYFLKFRRQLGILTFYFAFLHFGIYEILQYKNGINIFADFANPFILVGAISLFALLIGFLTSNNYSVKLLKSKRKLIQKFSYIAIIFVIIHVILLSPGESIGYIIFVIIYMILKYFEVKQKIIIPQTTNIPTTNLPTTNISNQINSNLNKFETDLELIKGKVLNHIMLTEKILELTIETEKELKVITGQRALLLLQDGEEKLNRAYSILKHEIEDQKSILTFAIKLNEESKSSSILKNLKIGEKIFVKGIYGHFILLENNLPKVFIGTGTGIVPIINMAENSKSTNKTLFFSVSQKSDLFYEDRIKKIKNLKVHIHLSKEKLPGYNFGRIDLSKLKFEPDSEFYICGNPQTVTFFIDTLKSMGFTKIYSEKFN
ncbi:MAG: FAD-binding oxidoreductase [Candidatus Absconditabacterales bacterium]